MTAQLTASDARDQADKIDYLDGLRGLAAFSVVLAHLATGFYPTLYTGDPRQAHHAWEVWLAGSPFNLVATGNCFVCIFFMLSAYVLTHSVLTKNRQDYLPALIVSRYVRLTLPILATGFIAWLILAQGWIQAARTSNSYWWLATLYVFEPDFLGMVRESLFEVYRFDTAYNPALWTMRIELLGSFMVFAILACCRSALSRLIAYVVFALFFFSPYYFCFIAGMFFYDIRHWSARERAANGFVSGGLTAALLVAGFFLGSYPYAYTIDTWYQGIADLLVPALSEAAIVTVHLAGAILLMLAVERSIHIKRLLTGRIFQFWGRNAFSIYLLHLILIVSVFSGVFNRALALTSYDMACAIAAFVFFLTLLTAASGLFRLVDNPSVVLSRRIGRAIRSMQQKGWRIAVTAWARP